MLVGGSSQKIANSLKRTPCGTFLFIFIFYCSFDLRLKIENATSVPDDPVVVLHTAGKACSMIVEPSTDV